MNNTMKNIERRKAQHTQRTQSAWSDEALAAAYLKGDVRAFAAIVDRHTPRLIAVARKNARTHQDAQDIVQEALLKASLHMHTFRSEAALATWLCRLVINAGYDHAKRADNKRRHLSLDDEDTMGPGIVTAAAYTPLAHFDRIMALRQILAKMPSANRRALMLIDVQGFSINNAARKLGVAPGTVKSRRHRAREMIVDYFTDEPVG